VGGGGPPPPNFFWGSPPPPGLASVVLPLFTVFSVSIQLWSGYLMIIPTLESIVRITLCGIICQSENTGIQRYLFSVQYCEPEVQPEVQTK